MTEVTCNGVTTIDVPRERASMTLLDSRLSPEDRDFIREAIISTHQFFVRFRVGPDERIIFLLYPEEMRAGARATPVPKLLRVK